MEPIITSLNKGMNTDTPAEYLKEGQYSFSLNISDETEQGDITFLSNDMSNALSDTLNKTIIGKCVISNTECVFFSTDGTVSEIGILKDGKYSTIIEDSKNVKPLNFKIDKWINATYRVRRGCERTIYFTDNFNKPRYFILDSPELFMTEEKVDGNKFNIQPTVNKVPKFTFQVLEGQGTLKPGQYYVAIAYGNSEVVETSWVNVSKGIIIYNSPITDNYADIVGNVYMGHDTAVSSPKSTKAIQVTISNIDSSFRYYRLAFIEKTTGTGEVSKVVLSDYISTANNVFLYTGTNFKEETSLSSIIVDKSIINKAKYIDQSNHRLILGNISEGIEYSILQKYASKIASKCVIKRLKLDSMTVDTGSSIVENKHNYKHPLHNITNTVGYMPGEIYSFGIVYVFDDGTTSPVFHIPGQVAPASPTKTEESEGVRAMSSNNATGYYYKDVKDYWGDAITKSSVVRHHRFPTREELGIDLIEYEYSSTVKNSTSNQEVKIIKYKIEPKETSSPDSRIVHIEYTYTNVQGIKSNGVGSLEIPTASLEVNGVHTSQEYNEIYFNDFLFLKDFEITKKYITIVAEETDSEGNIISVEKEVTDFTELGIRDFVITSDTIEVSQDTEEVTCDIYSNVLGVKFTNINKPYVVGKEIIGYYIVRNERTSEDTTVVESFTMYPSLKHKNYTGISLFYPESSGDRSGEVTLNVNKKVWGIISPSTKFGVSLDKSYKFVITGRYKQHIKKYSLVTKEDVKSGGGESKTYSDGDGWDFSVFTRNTYPSYERLDTPIVFTNNDYKEFKSLSALAYGKDKKDYIYNVAADQKVSYIKLRKDLEFEEGYMYVGYITTANNNVYSDFLSRPYFKENNNVEPFSSKEKIIFSGDSYVSGMTLQNSIFYDNFITSRVDNSVVAKAILKFVGAIALLTVGIIFGAGSTFPLAIGLITSAAGSAILLASSGIKGIAAEKAYSDHYKKGLKDTFYDHWVWTFIPRGHKFWIVNSPLSIVNKYFRGNLEEIGKVWHKRRRRDMTISVYNLANFHDKANAAGETGFNDDTIWWFTDCVSNVYYESSYNLELRLKLKDESLPNFPKCPNVVEEGNNDFLQYEDQVKALPLCSLERLPKSDIEFHTVKKFFDFDPKEKKEKLRDFPLGDLFIYNEDYKKKGIKPYYHYNLITHEDKCKHCFPYRFVWSEFSRSNDYEDKYKSFLPNDYKDIHSDTGEITNIVSIKNDLFIHTKYALYKQPLNIQEKSTSLGNIYIGTGDFGALPEQKMVDSENKLGGGILEHFHAIKSSFGYIYVSTEEGKIYKLTDSLEVISNMGMSKWFMNNLSLDSETIMPYLKYGIGFTLGIDYYKNRILFTKNNYSVPKGSILYANYIFSKKEDEEILAQGYEFSHIENGRRIYYDYTSPRSPKSFIQGTPFSLEESNKFTISYSIKTSSWSSFHSFFPNIYVSLGLDYYTILNGGNTTIWKHNIPNTYQTYYNKYYPSIIEYSVSKSPLTTLEYNSIRYHNEAYITDDSNYRYEVPVTFTHVLFYNSIQCSGKLPIKNSLTLENNKYMFSKIKNEQSVIVEDNEGDWSIGNFRDNRVEYNKPIFDDKLVIDTDNVLLNTTYSYNKKWYDKQVFRDKYLKVKLYFDNPDKSNVNIVYKFNITNNKISIR